MLWAYCNNIFFQAEDGIRDRTVTGVQTCALPISLKLRVDPQLQRAERRCARPPRRLGSRSEERRVGKESRLSGWWELLTFSKMKSKPTRKRKSIRHLTNCKGYTVNIRICSVQEIE